MQTYVLSVLYFPKHQESLQYMSTVCIYPISVRLDELYELL